MSLQASQTTVLSNFEQWNGIDQSRPWNETSDESQYKQTKLSPKLRLKLESLRPFQNKNQFLPSTSELGL